MLGHATGRTAHWWELTLECGHVAERTARARDLGPLVPPKRVSCPQCLAAPVMYVQVHALTEVGLTPGQALDATVLALQELAVAQALVMVHGPRRGPERYYQLGGCIRFDTRGNPYVPVARNGKIIKSA